MLSRALFLLFTIIQIACVLAQPRFSIPSFGRPGGSMPSFSAPSISGSAPAFSMPERPSITTPSMPDRPSISTPSFPTADRPSISTPSITTSSFTPPSSSSLPDPSTALSTLSSMSSTLSSVSSSLNLPDAFQSTARIMNQIPAIASQAIPSSIADVRTSNGDDYAGIPPSNGNSASSTSSSASAPASASAATTTAAAAPSPSSSQSLSLSVAQASRSTPVRGVSPFPYMAVDFVDPFNNPTNRIPEQPRASCTQMEVACQAYRRCYPCYADRSLSFCQTCLNLIRARTANDQLKEMCNLCKSDSSAMAICSLSEPYCPL